MSEARRDALRRAAERHYAPLATVLSARAAVMDARSTRLPPPGNDRGATWVAATALMLCWALEIDPNAKREAP